MVIVNKNMTVLNVVNRGIQYPLMDSSRTKGHRTDTFDEKVQLQETKLKSYEKKL